jgi:hypothetical protein
MWRGEEEQVNAQQPNADCIVDDFIGEMGGWRWRSGAGEGQEAVQRVGACRVSTVSFITARSTGYLAERTVWSHLAPASGHCAPPVPPSFLFLLTLPPPRSSTQPAVELNPQFAGRLTQLKAPPTKERSGHTKRGA